MVQELVFNVALLIFFIYCYFYIGATAPEPIPGELDGAQWPQILIVLLVICLGVNIYKILKNRPKNESFKKNFDLKNILKSKLFIGCLLVLVYSFALDYIGFLFGTLIFFMAYSRLLGQRQISKLLLSSVVCTAILYIIFDATLGIMLPRGKGIFRNIALMIESIF